MKKKKYQHTSLEVTCFQPTSCPVFYITERVRRWTWVSNDMFLTPVCVHTAGELQHTQPCSIYLPLLVTGCKWCPCLLFLHLIIWRLSAPHSSSTKPNCESQLVTFFFLWILKGNVKVLIYALYQWEWVNQSNESLLCVFCVYSHAAGYESDPSTPMVYSCSTQYRIHTHGVIRGIQVRLHRNSCCQWWSCAANESFIKMSSNSVVCPLVTAVTHRWFNKNVFCFTVFKNQLKVQCVFVEASTWGDVSCQSAGQ